MYWELIGVVYYSKREPRSGDLILSDRLNEKSRVLLNSLVEKYIEGGQPIASKILAGSSMVRVSPATVRSIMAELEELGYVSSPHPRPEKSRQRWVTDFL